VALIAKNNYIFRPIAGHLQDITILLKECHIHAYIARWCWDIIIITPYSKFIWWEV